MAALGHDVRLMPPQFVKPYVKSEKNDGEAIAEAVQRPTVRFMPIKSAEQQSVLMLHRTRDLLIRQRTSLLSAIRAHFAEFGAVVGQGIRSAPAWTPGTCTFTTCEEPQRRASTSRGWSERVIAEIMGWEEEYVPKIIRRYVGRAAATKTIIQQLNRAEKRT